MQDENGRGGQVTFSSAEAIEILLAIEHAEEAVVAAGPSALLVEVQDARDLVARRLFPDLPEN